MCAKISDVTEKTGRVKTTLNALEDRIEELFLWCEDYETKYDAANLLYMAQDMVEELLKDLTKPEQRASCAAKSGKRPC